MFPGSQQQQQQQQQEPGQTDQPVRVATAMTTAMTTAMPTAMTTAMATAATTAATTAVAGAPVAETGMSYLTSLSAALLNKDSTSQESRHDVTSMPTSHGSGALGTGNDYLVTQVAPALWSALFATPAPMTSLLPSSQPSNSVPPFLATGHSFLQAADQLADVSLALRLAHLPAASGTQLYPDPRGGGPGLSVGLASAPTGSFVLPFPRGPGPEAQAFVPIRPGPGPVDTASGAWITSEVRRRDPAEPTGVHVPVPYADTVHPVPMPVEPRGEARFPDPGAYGATRGPGGPETPGEGARSVEFGVRSQGTGTREHDGPLDVLGRQSADDVFVYPVLGRRPPAQDGRLPGTLDADMHHISRATHAGRGGHGERRGRGSDSDHGRRRQVDSERGEVPRHRERLDRRSPNPRDRSPGPRQRSPGPRQRSPPRRSEAFSRSRRPPPSSPPRNSAQAIRRSPGPPLGLGRGLGPEPDLACTGVGLDSCGSTGQRTSASIRDPAPAAAGTWPGHVGLAPSTSAAKSLGETCPSDPSVPARGVRDGAWGQLPATVVPTRTRADELRRRSSAVTSLDAPGNRTQPTEVGPRGTHIGQSAIHVFSTNALPETPRSPVGAGTQGNAEASHETKKVTKRQIPFKASRRPEPLCPLDLLGRGDADPCGARIPAAAATLDKVQPVLGFTPLDLGEPQSQETKVPEAHWAGSLYYPSSPMGPIVDRPTSPTTLSLLPVHSPQTRQLLAGHGSVGWREMAGAETGAEAEVGAGRTGRGAGEASTRRRGTDESSVRGAWRRRCLGSVFSHMEDWWAEALGQRAVAEPLCPLLRSCCTQEERPVYYLCPIRREGVKPHRISRYGVKGVGATT